MAAAAAFLVTGIPGAGKTTVSRALAERFPRGAHVEADALDSFIASGAGPVDRPDRLSLRARNAAMVADSFFDAGFVPVIDDVVVGPRRLRLYRRRLRARPLHLVVLAPPLDVALERDEGRGYKGVGPRWAGLDEDLRAGLAGQGLWLDTAGMTPAETVTAILAELA
jgi:adenylylsulfate kinase-like enzyme